MSNNTLAAKSYLSVTGAGTVVSGAVTVTYGPFTNYFHKGLYLFVNRTAETGTATLDAKLQMQDPSSATWTDVENAAVIQFADGSTRMNYLYMYPGIIGGDTDGKLIVNTNHNFVEGYLPYIWRVSVTTTGTTNTFGISAVLLP